MSLDGCLGVVNVIDAHTNAWDTQTHLSKTLNELTEIQSEIDILQGSLANALQSLESESHAECLKLSNTVAQDTDVFQGLIQTRLKVFYTF